MPCAGEVAGEPEWWWVALQELGTASAMVLLGCFGRGAKPSCCAAGRSHGTVLAVRLRLEGVVVILAVRKRRREAGRFPPLCGFLPGFHHRFGSMAVDISACIAEFVAMALFVFVGCGTACAVGCADVAGKLETALAFGLGITVLAYTVGAHSGGQINCAVTFGLLIASLFGVGDIISAPQAVANFVAQTVGAILGGELVAAVFVGKNDQTGGLGSNALGDGVTGISALVGEVLGTFLLVYVVLETAVNTKSEANRTLAPLAIGFAVFLAHCVLIAVDGCSINPTRTLGAAVAATLRHSDDGALMDKIWSPMWIFWVGPLVGAFLAVGCYKLVNIDAAPVASKGDATDRDQLIC
ncbi:unnamed protein product [Prorocentrum cordatum]|uniref:Aquaporin n=1 Tax=Prorocentrum cordatum TaxID=2364126 RepID=A0ABN9TQ64_9DINO|nr:unnamed protein product [Polarella glacialis]